MNIDQRLNEVADRYRAQGYQVVVRPGAEALPQFAKDFRVEILATRLDGNVLASAKGSPTEMAADLDLGRYAEVIEEHPGWRYDLFVLGPDSGPGPDPRDAKEQSVEEIRRTLDDAERLLGTGFAAASVVSAWAALESAMRHRLRALGREAGWETSPRTMLNELVSAGVLSIGAFRELERLLQLRNVIAHGFAAPAVEPAAPRLLMDTARGLLDELRPARQTA